MSREKNKLFILEGALIEASVARDYGKLGEKVTNFFTGLASNGSIYLVKIPNGYFAIIHHQNLGKFVAYEGTGEDHQWNMAGHPIEISEEEIYSHQSK